MSSFFKFVLLVSLAFCIPIILNAQNTDECPDIVTTALELLDAECVETGRNQACYGHDLIEVDVRTDIEDFAFSAPGDLIDIVTLETLRSSPLNETDGTWGVALISIQANIPNTIPGQNVRFLLLGDVSIYRNNNAFSDTVTLPIQATSQMNIRSGPSTNYAIVGSLTTNEAVVAIGRNEDSQWLKIQLPDGSNTGWVYAPLVIVDGDATTLQVESADSGSADFGPMQAFYFATGISEPGCRQAPQNGILIQTPEGVGEITLQMNEVTINLGSTAFIQATPDDEMIISVIVGRGRVEAFGEEQISLGGTRVRIPIDNTLVATGPPSPPEPCEASTLQGLPESSSCTEVEIHMPYECPGVAPNSMRLTLNLPHDGGFPTRELAEAEVEDTPMSILINGEAVDFIQEIYAVGEEGFGYDTRYFWDNPPAGNYSVTGLDQNGVAYQCDVTVIESPDN